MTIPTCAAAALGLDGEIVRCKSHNARRNMQRLCQSRRGLLSLKWAIYGRNGAADGFHLVSHADAVLLREQRSRWSRSLSWPKRVPADLDFRTGGMFG